MNSIKPALFFISEENSMDIKHSEETKGESEGFDLHLSQTQSFMFQTEKSAGRL